MVLLPPLMFANARGKILRICPWYRNAARVDFADEFLGLREVDACVDGAVDRLHQQWLEWRQCSQVVEARF